MKKERVLQLWIALLFLLSVLNHFFIDDLLLLINNTDVLPNINTYFYLKGLFWLIFNSLFFVIILFKSKKQIFITYSFFFVLSLLVYTIFFVKLNDTGLGSTGFIGTLSLLSSIICLLLSFAIILDNNTSKVVKSGIFLSSLGIILNKSYLYIFIVHYLAGFLTTSRSDYYKTFNVYDNVFLLFHAVTTLFYILSVRDVINQFTTSETNRKTLQF